MLPWQVAELLNNFASHFNCACCVSIILNSDVVICVHSSQCCSFVLFRSLPCYVSDSDV